MKKLTNPPDAASEAAATLFIDVLMGVEADAASRIAAFCRDFPRHGEDSEMFIEQNLSRWIAALCGL